MNSKLIAPESVTRLNAFRLRREGARDSKVYVDHLSGSHTDATRRLESQFQQRQLALNDYVASKVEPLLDGIRGIEVQIAATDRRIAVLKALKPMTLREQKQILDEIHSLQLDRDNNRLQRISNAEAVRAVIQSVTAANESWVRYFKQCVSIYQASFQRSRMKRSKLPLVTAASMTLPSFEAVQVVYPDGFEIEDSAHVQPVD